MRTSVLDHNIKDHNRYVADETALQKSQNGAVRVVGRRGVKRQYVKQNSDRVLTTVLATICANGTAIPPFVIFKGAQFQVAWGEQKSWGSVVSDHIWYKMCMAC